MKKTLIALCSLTLLAPACGQWVKYDEDNVPGGNGLDNFPQVPHLDHVTLGAVIAPYLRQSPDGELILVEYDLLSQDAERDFLLDVYLAMVATVDVINLIGHTEKLAYWLNGYNASVLRGVLDNYDGDPAFRVIDGNFFDDPVYTFGQMALSLNEVEHGIMRGDWEHDSVRYVEGARLEAMQAWHDDLWFMVPVFDARIHAGLNCAARSCPNLLSQAPFVFRSDLLDQQLDDAVVAWLDSAKGADPSGISMLFDWFRRDFEASHGTVDDFIAAFRTDGLNGIDTQTYQQYDWTLNIAENDSLPLP